jgi:AcrR family transcriptional regulator
MYEMASGSKRSEREGRRAQREAEQTLREQEQAERGEEQARRAEEQARRAEEQARREEEQAERTAERVARAMERADAKLDRAMEQVDRARRRADESTARALEKVERAREETMVWLREEPHARRPSHSRAEIAAAALAIADAEGFEAVSMRRVAQRLGAGTMTLYHYVRNKDELVALMVDAVMGELLVPAGELPAEWRPALTQIALRTRDAFRRHRWTLDRLGDGRPGPNAMRHFEQCLQAVGALDLGDEEKFELIGLVDDYVFGFALREAQETAEHERGVPPAVIEFFQRELDSGDYPLIRDFLGPDADTAADRVAAIFLAEGRFERGLDRLLDGVESRMQRG